MRERHRTKVWTFVCQAVLTFRPVLVCFNTELYANDGSNHAVVIGGVDVVDNGGTTERRVHLFDPWRQTAEWVPFPSGIGVTGGWSYPDIYDALAVTDDKWLAALNGARADEASVGEDADTDDVVTFDEDNPPDRGSPAKRFPSVPGGLNRGVADSDADGVRDDVEVQSTYGVDVLPAP